MSFVQVGNQKTAVSGAAVLILLIISREKRAQISITQSVKCSTLSNEPLKANCHGFVVPLTSTSEKPVIS